MMLPPHIVLKLGTSSLEGSWEQVTKVIMHGVLSGEYQKTGLFPSSWRYRNEQKAWGDSATEWGCVRSLVELAKVNERIAQRQMLEQMTFEHWLAEYRRRHVNSSIPSVEVLEAVYEDRLVAFDEETFGL